MIKGRGTGHQAQIKQGWLCLGFALAALFPQPSWAATGDGVDQAGLWLGALFRGDGVDGAAVGYLTAAVRQALGAYSIAMLAIAGLLLAWQIVSMIAETAHTGVMMGRRTNQLWVPLRFLLAISLLIPLSGGLNAGQVLVVKVAQEGSALASGIWREAVGLMGPHFQETLTPRTPDVAHVVATAFEMELCRSLYHQVYTAFAADPVVAQAGDMAEAQKNPAQRLSEETWLYTDSFFPRAALCGSYRFFSPEGPAGERAYADATRLVTERLVLQSRMAAERVAGGFLSANPAVAGDAAASLTGFVKEQTQIAQAQIQQTQNATKTPPKDQAANGWIEAGWFLWDQSKDQIALDALAARVVPRVKAPLLGHDALTRGAWFEAARTDPALRALNPAQFERYVMLYDRVSHAMRLARVWLYDRAPLNGLGVLPDQEDVADLLGPLADAETGASVYARLMTVGAASFGVLAQTASDDGATGGDQGVLATPGFFLKPLQTLVDGGQRMMRYGAWALGMLGPGLAEPATMTSAFLFGLVALAFVVAGAGLVYAVPFLPFVRFLAASMAWGLSVLGAVIALPLVALAHLYPSGEGLVGPLARRAYWQWLGVFLQPLAIVFGVLGGLVLFVLGVAFLNILFIKGIGGFLLVQSEGMWAARAACSLLYALSVLALAQFAFRGITLFPSTLLDWIGGQGVVPETLIQLPTTPEGKPEGPGGAASQTLSAGGGTAPGAGAASGRSAARGPAGRGGAAHPLDAVLFPAVREPPAAPVVIAKAEAYAYAKADQADGGKVEASATAVTQTDQDWMALQAMARQMVAGDKADPRMGSSALLPTQLKQDQDKESAAQKDALTASSGSEDAARVKKQESPEQSAAIQTDEDRAFDKGPMLPGTPHDPRKP